MFGCNCSSVSFFHTLVCFVFDLKCSSVFHQFALLVWVRLFCFLNRLVCLCFRLLNSCVCLCFFISWQWLGLLISLLCLGFVSIMDATACDYFQSLTFSHVSIALDIL